MGRVPEMVVSLLADSVVEAEEPGALEEPVTLEEMPSVLIEP